MRSRRVAFSAVLAALAISACSGSLHPAASGLPATRTTETSLPTPPPATASTLTRELYYLALAAHSARERGLCAPEEAARVPAKAQGSPDPALLAELSVLRRPQTAADTLPRSIRGNSPRGRYERYIRFARTTSGISYYIVPTTHPFELRPLTTACVNAIAATVRAHASRIPASLRARTLALAARELAARREMGPRQSGDGVCLLFRGQQLSGGQCGVNAMDVRRWGLITGFGPVSGIVPDGVATVTVHYAAGDGGHAVSSTARVINNVFVTSITRSARPGHWPTVTWRSSAGKVINTIRVQPTGVGGSGWCSGSAPGACAG